MGASRSGTQPLSLVVSIIAPGWEPEASECLGPLTPLVHPYVWAMTLCPPLHVWPCPGFLWPQHMRQQPVGLPRQLAQKLASIKLIAKLLKAWN